MSPEIGRCINVARFLHGRETAAVREPLSWVLATFWENSWKVLEDPWACRENVGGGPLERLGGILGNRKTLQTVGESLGESWEDLGGT